LLGSFIRFVVDSLSWLFGLIGNAGHEFLDGLSRTLGMDRSLLSIGALVIGLLLLVAAGRALFRGGIISGVILLLLALWLLSLIIH
jgi:hypothetical protein